MADNSPKAEATSPQKSEAASTEAKQGMSLPKIFDLSILTQSKDGKETQGKLYNYFWKRYDFRGGRTLNQVQEEHPYCKDPLKSMSKSIICPMIVSNLVI